MNLLGLIFLRYRDSMFSITKSQVSCSPQSVIFQYWVLRAFLDRVDFMNVSNCLFSFRKYGFTDVTSGRTFSIVWKLNRLFSVYHKWFVIIHILYFDESINQNHRRFLYGFYHFSLSSIQIKSIRGVRKAIFNESILDKDCASPLSSNV